VVSLWAVEARHSIPAWSQAIEFRVRHSVNAGQHWEMFDAHLCGFREPLMIAFTNRALQHARNERANGAVVQGHTRSSIAVECNRMPRYGHRLQSRLNYRMKEGSK